MRRGRTSPADLAVFPGLVDAHVHLQLPPIAGRRTTFVEWIRAVLQRRAAMTAVVRRRETARAVRLLLASGATAVGEIDSFGDGPAVLAGLGVAGRCYQEVTGFHLDATGADRLLAGRTVVMPRGSACGSGLSPHAPYSVSAALFRACAQRSRSLAVHVAEVPEEQQFLREGRGPFADLLADLGRLPAGFRAPGVGAVRWLEALGVLRPTTLLIHCQELERGDVRRIAAAGAAIAVCPGTIEYFGRAAPPLAKWLAAGIRVALGTDSRASNGSLSMADELQRAARLWPDVAPAALLAAATTAGGAALGRPGLGRLRRGGRADFFCVEAGVDDRDAILAAFVHGDRSVCATFLCGRRTPPPAT